MALPDCELAGIRAHNALGRSPDLKAGWPKTETISPISKMPSYDKQL